MEQLGRAKILITNFHVPELREKVAGSEPDCSSRAVLGKAAGELGGGFTLALRSEMAYAWAHESEPEARRSANDTQANRGVQGSTD
jgi:hypothetical protein